MYISKYITSSKHVKCQMPYRFARFATAGMRAWIRLSAAICPMDISFDTFKNKLKSHYFNINNIQQRQAPLNRPACYGALEISNVLLGYG